MPTSAFPVLLAPAELAARLDEPGLLLIDLCAPEVYAQGHIAGAVNLAYAALVRAAPPVMGLLPDMAQLSSVLSAIGLTSDAWVVAYDNEGNGRAGRLLWTLAALGHTRLSMLNGGLVAWLAENRPVSQASVMPTASDYAAQLANPGVVADKNYILGRLGESDFLALDARTAAEYRGEDVRSARGGHIPGAGHLNWLDTMNPANATQLLPDADLRRLLEERGVTPDKEVVVYCQTHHRSSHTFIVLKHLGYPRVRGYAGAWSDWGNDPSLPVER